MTWRVMTCGGPRTTSDVLCTTAQSLRWGPRWLTSSSKCLGKIIDVELDDVVCIVSFKNLPIMPDLPTILAGVLRHDLGVCKFGTACKSSTCLHHHDLEDGDFVEEGDATTIDGWRVVWVRVFKQ